MFEVSMIKKPFQDDMDALKMVICEACGAETSKPNLVGWPSQCRHCKQHLPHIPSLLRGKLSRVMYHKEPKNAGASITYA